ncbi:unnamed protein product, partial [Iphiclides podalirius]
MLNIVWIGALKDEVLVMDAQMMQCQMFSYVAFGVVADQVWMIALLRDARWRWIYALNEEDGASVGDG